MQSVSAFIKMQTRGVGHMTYIFFASSIGKVNCAKFHQCKKYVHILERGAFLSPLPSVNSPEKAHPE